MNTMSISENPVTIVNEGHDWECGDVLFLCQYCGTTFIADETQYSTTIVDGNDGYFTIHREVRCPLCRRSVRSYSRHKYSWHKDEPPHELETVSLPPLNNEAKKEKSSFWKKIRKFFGR